MNNFIKDLSRLLCVYYMSEGFALSGVEPERQLAIRAVSLTLETNIIIIIIILLAGQGALRILQSCFIFLFSYIWYYTYSKFKHF